MTPTPVTVAVGIFSTPVWTLHASQVERLRARFPDVRFLHAQSRDELDAAIAHADVAFSSLIRESTFARARRLRWVHASAAGVGGTLFPELVDSDVIVTNARGMMSASIAEHVLGSVLAWRRRLHVAVRRQASHLWAQEELAQITASPLNETRALIVGMGSIGEAVRAHLCGVGMAVSGVGRTPRPGRPGVDALPALLPDADIVIIAAPHTDETDQLFDAPLLARMKDGSLLVNIGRGRIIDETALIEALRAGRPAGAVLDVFEREPLPPGSPLWDMEQVILTPHVAGFGHQFWTRMVDLFADNLDRWRRGAPLENIVDKRRGY